MGAGHAGCEAALAAAGMGLKTALYTLNVDLIAQMSCNPAVGGIAKGHLVREVDALGGIMGEITDAVGIQFRLLNTSRGPAVWSPRAQCDKQAYRLKMREVLESQPNLKIKQAEIADLIVEESLVVGRSSLADSGGARLFANDQRLMTNDDEHRRVIGIRLRDGRTVGAAAVIITTAYRDYAVEGFELEVLDYLVKPCSFTRFMQAMQKVSRVTGKPAEGWLTEGKEEVGEEKESLFLKVDRELVRIWIREICYIESRKDYIRVNTTKGEWLCHQSLTDMTAKLPGEKFFRLHRSYTVALDKIELFRNNNVHIQGKVIPVSRENRQELRRRLSK